MDTNRDNGLIEHERAENDLVALKTSPAQKRTSYINLSKMRKSFALKPLAIGVTGVLLSACSSDKQDATVYTNLQDCVDQNPSAETQCKLAFEEAQKEAERTAPKYNSQYDCEYEFGANQCRNVQSGSGSFFMPFMAGYMVSSLLSPRPYYQPMFTSYSRNSSYRNNWIGADGTSYGDTRKRNLKVRESAFDKKPAVTRTIQRGGFGSSVRAKSAWGSKSSSKGWGG